uniref:LRAT domain-containing protein n=1 Tax=Panagrolaimus sp. PS1159 TaxID=55785 RepID=A0AC35GR10_9BILA
MDTKFASEIDNLTPGDIIQIKIRGGFFSNNGNLEIEHYGIYVGDKKVVHNKPGSGWMMAGPDEGVEICSFEDFIALSRERGKPWKTGFIGARDFRFDENSKVIGEKAYHFRTNNGQHFAFHCCYGINYSYQFIDNFMAIFIEAAVNSF